MCVCVLPAVAGPDLSRSPAVGGRYRSVPGGAFDLDGKEQAELLPRTKLDIQIRREQCHKCHVGFNGFLHHTS